MTLDLSAGGLKAAFRRPVAFGDRYAVVIGSSDHRLMERHAQVVWAHPAGENTLAGLRFMEAIPQSAS
jgi:c-di-GMP-binding flagellar brake protein YcgR